MPSGWRSARLGELAKVNPEQLGNRTDPNYVLKYLDIAAIEQPGAIGASRTLSFAEAPSRARRRARAGDILVSTVRPYLRNFARVRESLSNLVVSTGYAVIRPRDEVDGRFLYQHVLSDGFVEFLKPRMSGSNYPAVKGDDVEAYTLSVPPLAEQRKIAAILSSVDDAIEKTQAVIDQVQVVKRGLMQTLLTRGLPGRHTRFRQTEIGEIPETWEVVQLGQLFKLTSGKSISVRSLDGNRSSENPCPVYGGNGIAGFTSSFTAVPPLLVVGRVGEYCGIVHHPGESCWVSDNALYTREWLRSVNVGFLHRLLQFVNLAKLRKKSGQPLVTQAPIHDFKVSLAPVSEQDKIAEILDRLDSRLRVETRQVKCLQNAKRALMSVLLTGELRVTPDIEAA